MVSHSSLLQSLARCGGLAAFALLALAAAGCATVDEYMPTLRNFGVYKLDIIQGNYLSLDMVDRLRGGQTKAQVQEAEAKSIVAKLARWEGDEMPASQADLNREALARTASEANWGEPRSWWDSILDIFRN